MAVLNVTQSPYNAAGDGTTDDRDAINSALQDAQDGDTVYLPGPATYLVTDPNAGTTTTSDVFILDRDGSTSTAGNVANLEIRGDGEGTIVKMDETQSSFHSMFTFRVRGGWTDMHVHDLEFDGDNANTTGEGFGVLVEDPDTLDTDSGIRFVNVRSFDWERTCFRNLAAGTHFERCTAETTNAFHGFSHGGETGAGEVTFKHCLAKNVGGYPIDLSGTATVEDTVMTGGGTGGTKITPELRANGFATYRRCRAINNSSGGFKRISPSNVAGHDVTYEDCVSENNDGLGFRLAGSDTVTIGHVLNKGNNAGNLRNNTFLVTDDAQISSATLIESEDSLNGASGSSNGSTATHSIDTYRHFNNAGGGGDFDGASYVTTTENTDPTGDISSVPTESEVGAFSATQSTSTVAGLDVSGGSLTVRSGGSVGIGAPPAGVSVIDDWEDGDWAEWTNENGTAFETTTDATTAFNGDVYGQSASGGNVGGMASAPGDGLNDYFAAGETSKVYFYHVNTLDEQLWIWWGLGATSDLLQNGYYLRYQRAPDDWALFEEVGNDGGTEIGDIADTALATDTWHEWEIQWASGGDITCTLTEDPAGTNTTVGTIGPVTPTNDFTANEGIGFYKDGDGVNPVYMDYWHIP